MTLRSPVVVDGRGPRPYSAGMAARKKKPAPAQERPGRKADIRARLDALDQLQASLRARGVDLRRWEQDVLAARREAGLERMARIRNAILETSGRCAALPDLDDGAPDEILGYDEHGGFAEAPRDGRAAPDHAPTAVCPSRGSAEEP